VLGIRDRGIQGPVADAGLPLTSVDPLSDHRCLPGRRIRLVRWTAIMLLAECGADMSVFRTASHLASWSGICPDNNTSGGKNRSGDPPTPPRGLRAPTLPPTTPTSVVAGACQKPDATTYPSPTGMSSATSRLHRARPRLAQRRRSTRTPHPTPRPPTPTTRPHRHRATRAGKQRAYGPKLPACHLIHTSASRPCDNAIGSQADKPCVTSRTE
jgi:hypothetical protein